MTTRRWARAAFLAVLLGAVVAAVASFAAGAVAVGLAAVAAGLGTLVVAGRHARPANWTPEHPGDHRDQAG